MSHVVLARKYRPHSFEQMVGQAHVVQALGNALTSGRLHHAYLFTGTRGIGKTTVSRILAKSLNCTGPDGQGGITAHPCGVCQACVEIDADRYMDYTELDAASNRSIDEIRDLIERAAYKPSVGRFKVFMIDEAHQLTKDAFNALLKTLEEPPDYLKFVLATTDPDKMLPTVLSRCLQFNLRPMAPDTVQQHLAQVLQAEAVAAEPGALRLLARAARGSMRDALSLTDQAIAYGAGSLTEDGVRAMLGTVDRSHAAALVQALAGRDGPGVLATVQALRETGLSAAGTLEEMAALLQQMAVEQAVPGALDAEDPDTAGARQLAGLMPPDETQLLYSMVLHGRAELSLVSDDYAGLTMVLLRLLAFPPAGSGPAAAAAPRAVPLVAAPAVSRSSAPARPVASAPTALPAEVPLPAPVPPRAPPSTVGPTAAKAQARPVVPVGAPSPPALAAVPSGVAKGQDTSVPMGAQGPQAPAAPLVVDRPIAAAAPVAPLPRTPARPASANEPPPWVSDDLPDEAAGAHQASVMSFADEPTSAPPEPAPAADAASPTQQAGLPPLQPTALGALWAQWLRPLIDQGLLTALVRELAWQAELVARDPSPAGGHVWQLRVERESLRNPALRDKLAAVMTTALAEPVDLQLQPGVALDSIARRDALAREQAQRRAEQQIHDDPAVRALMGQFRTARIVPGSIQPVSPETEP